MADRRENAAATALASTLLLSIALTTSACSSSMKTPDIKQNPQPKMRYAITLTIQDAPGPFDSIGGFVQYKVSNGHCVPLTPISGATLPPESRVPISFTRVSDKLYKGVIYTDLMQDEDYYNMGVCHWSVVAVSADLKIKAATLSPAIFHDDIVAQKSVNTYFVNNDYFDTNTANGKERVVSGSPNRAYYLPASRTDLFSIALAAKEDFQ
ncbi:MAG: hypothetical protein ACYC0F_08085 [Rhodanobacter sp.]